MIETYQDLQTQLVEWIGNQRIVSQAANCIQLAEARIRNDMLIRRMERAVHGTFDGAVIFLPVDCEAIQRLMYYIGDREFSVPMGSSKVMEGTTVTTGDPIGYVMMDQSVVLYPTPNAARSYSLYYIPYIADLTVNNTSNWLLDRSPHVYLFAACLEAAGFLQDEQLMGVFEGRYQQAMDSMFQASERQRMPSSTPLVTQPYRPVGNR